MVYGFLAFDFEIQVINENSMLAFMHSHSVYAISSSRLRTTPKSRHKQGLQIFGRSKPLFHLGLHCRQQNIMKLHYQRTQ